MTHNISIKSASRADEDQVISALTLAFATDPMLRWFYKTPHEYLSHFPDFVRVYAGKAFESESAHYISDFKGAALWLPPGVEPDQEQFASFMQRTISPSVMEDFLQTHEEFQAYSVDEARGHGASRLLSAFISYDPHSPILRCTAPPSLRHRPSRDKNEL